MLLSRQRFMIYPGTEAVRSRIFARSLCEGTPDANGAITVISSLFGAPARIVSSAERQPHDDDETHETHSG